MDEISPRAKFDGLVLRAAEIVLDACRDDKGPIREYTVDDLDALAYVLTFSLVAIRKLPGGDEAMERCYEAAIAERDRRKVAK